MDFLLQIIIQLPILLISLTIHEYSHGYVAYRLGDDTAKRAGRLTLNPISHIDPLGLIMLFIARIGWAKPVPINPYNFNDQKRDMAISAAAGPLSNFAFAIILSVIFNLIKRANPEILHTASSVSQFWLSMLLYAILINLALGIFNLIPVPPMDGSKILGGFLSDEAYYKYTAQEQKGAQILMIVLVVSFVFRLNIIGAIIMPPLNFFLKLLTGITL
ncbi:MAG: site-2 protease family protein [Candidatus Cloacimonetes bacterium]|nr:site-2 protease family protein [Candidatus Cloacimonadota bacterium]MCF7815226.1 site-2 protease family protein [Candidatus Cloacimonadota bacterium]MCF7868421.1 site-2 protease family protein [Candidatus Cloacimonadota bacterium]MCF7883894.1 site-2 protease family protein [Candidatus Cloacimonadota bacterium]